MSNDRVIAPEDLFPGDVIESLSLDILSRSGHGIGVVSNVGCASGCGFLVMFTDGWVSAQCTDSLVRFTDVRYAR